MEKPLTRFVQISLLAILIGLGPWTASPVVCQIDKPNAANGVERITQDDIEARRKKLDELADLDDQLKKGVSDLYQQALQHLDNAKKAEIDIVHYDRRLAAATTNTANHKTTRDSLPEKSPAIVPPPPDVPIAELEKEFAVGRKTLAAKEDAYKKLEAEPNRRIARVAEIPKLIQAAEVQLAQIEEELTANPAADEPTQLASAHRTLALAKREDMFLTIESLKKEREYCEATDELVQIDQDIAAKQLAMAKDVAEQWQELLNVRRAELARKQATEAEQTLAESPPAIQKLAEENAKLAQQRKDLAEKMKNVSAELPLVRDRLEQISIKLARTKEQVLAGGLSQASGELLRREQQSQLLDVRRNQRNIEKRQPELKRVRFDSYDLNYRRTELATLEHQVDEIVSTLGVKSTKNLRQNIRKELETQRDYLDQIINDYRSYSTDLVELDAEEQGLIAKTLEYAHFIDSRVLWIKNMDSFISIAQDDQLRTKTFRGLLDAIDGLISWRNWQDVGRELTADMRQTPVVWIGLSIVFAPLLVFQRRWRRKIAELGKFSNRKGFSQFLPTLQVLGFTALVSVLWPAWLFFLGWRMGSSLFATDFSRAVSAALLTTATVLLSFELLRQVCRPNGLADVHFDWPCSAVKLVWRQVRWFIVAGVPLLFISLVADSQSPWSTSLGRVAFIVFLVLFATCVQRVLRPSGHVFQQLFVANPSSWLYRLRYAWYPVVVASPILLALLTAAGYYETAQVLSRHLFETVWLVIALAIVGALLNRWVLMSRRRLALEQLRQRSTAAAQATPDSHSPAILSLTGEVEAEVDLASLSDQTKQLIRTCLLLAAILVGWLVWKDVIPALAILRTIPAWPGATHPTLAQLILSMFVLTITYVATKNVPGLLELTVLKHLPLDAGARYATTALSRYLMAIVGVALAGQSLGITWASIQWLIAAMGIGLGFGLQEIFANFISGIILLFERPIRVGDIITLGDTTGVVRRIRMRATTITDWDRKEYVVPNKDLITGRLLNWTLSDQTNRIVINVGVAYRSDTVKARELLLRVANEHPLILADPAPIATFEGFGDNTLNLVLRCYLPSFDGRLPTITELHTDIDEAFRGAGIEIAFPQLDIHLRSEVAELKAVVRNSKPTTGKLHEAKVA